MIAFYIAGDYYDTGVTEYCYDEESGVPAFIRRYRRYATDEWVIEDMMELPDLAGLGLLNALAHADPVNALRVADHLREHGPVRAWKPPQVPSHALSDEDRVMAFVKSLPSPLPLEGSSEEAER